MSAYTYKKNTLGSDMWKATEVAGLPPVAQQILASPLNSGLNTIATPHQLLISLNPVLGKEVGVRTICKTPMLNRLVMRVDKSIRQWEISHKTNFDTATVKSPALLAPLERNLKSRSCVLVGGVFSWSV